VQQVVGAAILRGGQVLAARRTLPVTAAGRWEFPGGKVEEGESPGEALVREISEELGCRIEVTGWLTERVMIGSIQCLTVATAQIVAGDPQPTEHDAVRWLGAEQLEEVDWLDADRPFLDELRDMLLTGSTS
jgi:8-oxo-dGTP diphosphatase